MHTSEYVYCKWKLLEYTFLPSPFNTHMICFYKDALKNVYTVEVQNSNYMIIYILVALTEIRANLKSWFVSGTTVNIFMKPVFRLEEVTLSSSCEEICVTVCKSPLHVQIFALNWMTDLNWKEEITSEFLLFIHYN